MHIAEEVVDPLGVVIDVVPPAPTAKHKDIQVVNNRDIGRKVLPVILAEIQVLLVVPGVELARILLLRHVLVIVDQIDALVPLEEAKVLHIPPIICHSG